MRNTQGFPPDPKSGVFTHARSRAGEHRVFPLTLDFPGGHSLGMSHEKLHSVKNSRQFLTKYVLKAILLKNRVFFLTKRRAMFSEVIIIANFAAALLQGRVRIPIGG